PTRVAPRALSSRPRDIGADGSGAAFVAEATTCPRSDAGTPRLRPRDLRRHSRRRLGKCKDVAGSYPGGHGLRLSTLYATRGRRIRQPEPIFLERGGDGGAQPHPKSAGL